MNNKELSTAALSERIAYVAKTVRQAVRNERGEDFDENIIAEAMRHCVASKLDVLEEEMEYMFTMPARSEFQQLLFLLDQRALEDEAETVVEKVFLAEEYRDESVFTGNRQFSKTKMAAMIEHLTSKGNFVYKTALNKLLFYSDLTNFYLQGVGMSGAMYHNRRFGPVADPAEPLLNELIREEKVNIDPRTRTLEAATTAETQALSDNERKVLDWVADTYGKMNASEVSEFSHNELAYKNTSPNEPIAYAYGKFFKYLPPKSLLD
jgi:uncharacterized phage-associated protein